MWLKESWATYMEIVWHQHKHDKDRVDQELLEQRWRFFSEVNNRYSRPIETRHFDSP